jgi:hypothetical protein
MTQSGTSEFLLLSGFLTLLSVVGQLAAQYPSSQAISQRLKSFRMLLELTFCSHGSFATKVINKIKALVDDLA